MITYTTEIVSWIRKLDSIKNRPISSGFACRRPNAYHLFYDNQSWIYDSKKQWKQMVILQNTAVDIISCHDYGKYPYFNQTQASTQEISVAIEVQFQRFLL